MTYRLQQALSEFIKGEYNIDIDPTFSITEEIHGDLSTNLAMQLAGLVGANPREIADKLKTQLEKLDELKEVTIAGPGFINLRFVDNFIYQTLNKPGTKQTSGAVLLEYSCPNAFKELHTGHLYQTLIGDSMSRVYEYSGWQVFRTSFGGDVGLHAGKCMWGIIDALGGENPEELDSITDRSAWIARAYVKGSAEYENNEDTKLQIEELNKRIYKIHEDRDTSSDFSKIYFTCRQWSYDYFEEFYNSISVKPFNQYYPESQTMNPGLEMVESNIGTVFTESQSAIVLDESKSGLHTRVFITSAGLPTYETKDLGVIKLEADQFPYDKRIIMTGNDQSEYMKVVFKALELIDPDLAKKQSHKPNGTVKFGDGKKMSSRLGNVSRATDVLEAVKEEVRAETEELKNDITLGAVKYSMLKARVGGDISFDIDQSISLEGNSGPYLQYALVRARSIVRKVGNTQPLESVEELDPYERRLAYKLTCFESVIDSCLTDFSPHHICTYLYELATVFNQFYENSRVIDDPRSDIRTILVKKYEETLSTGLELLGIPQPEKM